MQEARGAEPVDSCRHDRRAAVLVLIGLCVCLPHLYRALGRMIDFSPQEKPPLRLVWLEAENAQVNGLYGLDGPSWTWPASFATPGCDLPSPPSLPGDVLLPAYRLTFNGLPQAIAYPASLAPLFFQPIPINQADIATLLIIPGVGRRLASSIIDYRNRGGGIKNRAALMAVEGIGEKKAAIIEEYICYE